MTSVEKAALNEEFLNANVVFKSKEDKYYAFPPKAVRSMNLLVSMGVVGEDDNFTPQEEPLAIPFSNAELDDLCAYINLEHKTSGLTEKDVDGKANQWADVVSYETERNMLKSLCHTTGGPVFARAFALMAVCDYLQYHDLMTLMSLTIASVISQSADAEVKQEGTKSEESRLLQVAGVQKAFGLSPEQCTASFNEEFGQRIEAEKKWYGQAKSSN